MMMTLTTYAQTAATQAGIGNVTYKGKIGLTHVRNASDAQLSAVGKHISDIAMPTKAETAKMLRNALENRPSKAKQVHARTKNALSTAQYSTSDSLLFESWEEWDGHFAWVPSTWTRFENFDKSLYNSETDGMCPTWMVSETDGYYMPYATDGSNVLMCMYGSEVLDADGKTVIAPAPDQNEWIVSPVVSGIQSANFIIFDLAFSPLYSHYFAENGQQVIDMNRLAYDVEVLVTTNTGSASNNEADYTKVFRLSDIIDEMMGDADLSDETTVAQLMNMRWQHFKISLANYEDKSIRVAFRYKGTRGGTVLLDNVRISDMLPMAKFNRPEGSFFMGFSDDARLNYTKSVLMPAYTETVWLNYSNKDADAYQWSWAEGEETVTSSDYNLTLPARNPGEMVWPTLKATSGARSDSYSGGADVNINNSTIHSDNGTAKIGGDALLTYSDGSQINFSLGNFDPTKLYWIGEIGATAASKAYAFGTGSGLFWAQVTDYKYNAVNGIANVYEAPASPYVFNKVMMPLGDLFNMGATITCTVYKAKELEDGGIEVTQEVLGQASTTEATAGVGGHIMNFNFPDVMVVDTPIAISVTGFDNPNLLDLAPLSQAYNHDNNRSYGYVLLKNASTGDTWWCDIAGKLSAVDGDGKMMISHCLGMNAVFPYLKSLDGNLFESKVTESTKTFEISSYWHPEKNVGTDAMNGWTIECSDSWVKTELEVNGMNGNPVLKVTTEALPSDINSRMATVTITAMGCEEVINVSQSKDSGSGNGNNIFFNAARQWPGKQITMPLMMNNKAEITAMQFDVVLPDGITLDKNEKGKYALEFNAEAGRTDASIHTLSSSLQPDGSIRILCYSVGKEAFLGNSGSLIDFPLTIAEDVKPGEYDIVLKNIILTATDKKEYKMPEVICKLIVPDYEMGDANGDKLINVTDIVYIADYILGNADPIFNYLAADMNEDEDITVTDIVYVADKILDGTDNEVMKSKAVSRKSADKAVLSILPFTISQGKSMTVTLDMSNPEREVTAFQCEVYLPEGLTIDKNNWGKYKLTFDAETGRTDASCHTISAAQYNTDAVKFLCYSVEKDAFHGENGAVIDIPLTAADTMADGEYIIRIENIIITCTDKSEIKPADTKTTVTISNPTSMQLQTAVSTTDAIYNINGQQQSATGSGINIMRMCDGMVKKVVK